MDRRRAPRVPRFWLDADRQAWNILRGILVILAALILITWLAGCTAVQQKGEAYQEAAGRFLYPDKLKICYVREGQVQRGVEYRCFGEGCDLPKCPNGE